MNPVFERRRTIRSAALWLLATVSVAPAAEAMTVGLFTVFSPIRFEDILPADCLIFGSLDLDSEGGDKLSIRRILDEPEIKAFAGSVSERARGIQSLVNKIWGDPATSAGLSQMSRIGFSLGGVRSVSSSGRAEPSLALAIEITGDKAGFLRALGNLRDMAGQGLVSGRPSTVTEKHHNYAGQEITELSLGSGAGDLQVAYTLIDSLFVAAADPISVQSLVDNYRTPPPRPLSRLDTFLKSRERAGGADARLLVFFNLQAFREAYLGHLSEEECATWKAFGLEDVDGVCYTLSENGSSCDERIFVHAPKARSFWLMNLESPKVDDYRSLDLVSRDSAYYQAWKGDWSKTLDEIEALLGALEPEQLPAIRGLEARFEKETGVRLREDLLASLGEEVSISALIQPGSPVPHALVTIEVGDLKKFDAAFESILAAAGLEMEPLPGTSPERIRQIVPKKLGSGKPNPLALLAAFGGLTPAVLQEGNTFLVASHPTLLKPIVAGGGKGLRDSIRSHPDLSRAIAEAGPRTSSIELVDLKRIFTLLYGIATPVILSAPRESLPFDAALLPTAESIARHLSAATMTSRIDPEGFIWRCTSPLPFGAIALGALACAAVMVSGLEIDEPGFPVPARATSESSGATPQSAEKAATLERNARRLELAGNLPKAIETMNSAIETSPTSGSLRFTRGLMKITDGKNRAGDKSTFASAREDFLESIRLGFNPAVSQYNVACTFALEGRKDDAFAALRKSLEVGFDRFRMLREDPDLASLRGDARFAAIIREIEAGGFDPKSEKR